MTSYVAPFNDLKYMMPSYVALYIYGKGILTSNLGPYHDDKCMMTSCVGLNDVEKI